MVYLCSLHALLAPLLLGTQVYGKTLTQRQLTSGDRQCSSTMCISAAVNGSNIEYVLSSTGRQSLGWMAMGFGQRMANTPMVIMWANSDGSVTVSQRKAARQVQPTVDPNPPRIATFVQSLTTTSGNTPSFAFSVPADGNTGQQTVIYASGDDKPGSAAPDANLQLHIDNGVLRINPSKGSPSTPTTPGSASSGVPGDSQPEESFPNNGLPLLPFQRLVVVHAIFCAIGFLLFLPTGALLARWLRTFTPVWFKAHWAIQFYISGPIIIIGIALGYRAVDKAGALHFNDPHKQLGLALLLLYLIQCALGAVIHFVKPKNRTRRPLQNYLHAIVGLVTIALAFYQVYYGFKIEWLKTGLVPFPYGVSILFYVWVVLIPVMYFAGLALLSRQFNQENLKRQQRAVTVKYDAVDVDHDGYDDVYRDRR